MIADRVILDANVNSAMTYGDIVGMMFSISIGTSIGSMLMSVARFCIGSRPVLILIILGIVNTISIEIRIQDIIEGRRRSVRSIYRFKNCDELRYDSVVTTIPVVITVIGMYERAAI